MKSVLGEWAPGPRAARIEGGEEQGRNVVRRRSSIVDHKEWSGQLAVRTESGCGRGCWWWGGRWEGCVGGGGSVVRGKACKKMAAASGEQ